MFKGLSAFPLTPLVNDSVDADTFATLVRRLAAAGVDSITALGSTGSYAFLTYEERTLVSRVAVENAGTTPVFIGVGSLRTSDVLANAKAAEEAGANGLLLAPMSYQPLTDSDVYELFRALTENTSLPVIVYDNPGTTRFIFTKELYARIAELPGIASIKIPPLPTNQEEARSELAEIRKLLPKHVTVGVSGDGHAASGLAAGCDAWYSVVGGTLPELALSIVRAADRGDHAEASALSVKLEPLWHLYTEFGGSLRVIAAVAELLGLVQPGSLPLPIQGLDALQRGRVSEVLQTLELLK